MQVRAINHGTYKGISYLHGNVFHIDDSDFDSRWMENMEPVQVDSGNTDSAVEPQTEQPQGE